MYLRDHDQSAASLKGVGPKTFEALRSLGVDTIWKLILYAPRDYIDRSLVVSVAHAVGQTHRLEALVAELVGIETHVLPTTAP